MSIASAKTSTGDFPIGFRQVGSAWQKDTGALVRWAAANGFASLDFNKENAVAGLHALRKNGLRAGAVDLFARNDYEVVIAPDSNARREAIRATGDYLETCAAAGATIFFAVTIPADKQLSRRQNFEHLIGSFAALVPVLERSGASVVIEGWPGPGAVCCTPEVFRAFFKEIGSDRFGVNYDPSHLLRMGIDPVRFLREFASRVHHVHAKDTALSAEGLYEFGHELSPAFAPPRRWGNAAWRYTIPGHGQTPWSDVFGVLREAGYRGQVSVELEDENFNGTEAGEQRGLIEAREFLAGC